ncbi:MAG: SHOCT domain-containing protein [Cyanobacteria bacterium]|nr:SHOCT domain-containing protein [Cyanobacteriota bacterium]
MRQAAEQQAGTQTTTRRRVAAALAFAGALNPLPLPLAGLHKFYLGHPRWGVIYLLLNWTQVPRIACALEGVWYLLPWPGDRLTPTAPSVHPQMTLAQQTQLVAATIRDLEQLRQDGLITEWEFEQQRRQLLEPAEG